MPPVSARRGGHIAGGTDATQLGQAVLAHAEKDAAPLESVVIKKELSGPKPVSAPGVRDQIRKNLSQKAAAPSNSKSPGV